LDIKLAHTTFELNNDHQFVLRKKAMKQLKRTLAFRTFP